MYVCVLPLGVIYGALAVSSSVGELCVGFHSPLPLSPLSIGSNLEACISLFIYLSIFDTVDN